MGDHTPSESPTELSCSPVLFASSPTDDSPTLPSSPTVIPPTPLEPSSKGQSFPNNSSPTSLEPILDTHLSRSPTKTEGELLPGNPPVTGSSRFREAEVQPKKKPSLQVQTSSAALRRPKGHHRRHSSTHRVREAVDVEQKLLDDGSRIINRYKIGRSLGRGSYASVELATDIGTDELFAIKEFSKSRLRRQERLQNAPGRRRPPVRGEAGPSGQPERANTMPGPEMDDNEDPLKLIRREIAVMKKLDHPNIVHLYAAISSKADALFLVLEYMPGGVLLDVKLGEQDAKSPFTMEQIRAYFRQLVLGLEYLHWNDIVHRDIKPENILFSEDKKTVKLCDFGVSEMFQTPGDDTLKRSGGTTAFLSPESIAVEIHGQTVHAKGVDIWALGVTLFCMLTGRLPFDRDNFEDLRKAIVHEPIKCPDDWTDSLKDLVTRMLWKDPHGRIQMDCIRSHAWLTNDGAEPLISTDENLYDLGKHVEEPTNEELGKAIGTLRGAFTVVRAVYKFKRLLHRSRVASGQSTPSLDGSQRADSTAVSSMDSYTTDPTTTQDDSLNEDQDVVQSPKELDKTEFPGFERDETPTTDTVQVLRTPETQTEADRNVAFFATAFIPSRSPKDRANAFVKLAEFCRGQEVTERTFTPMLDGADEDEERLLGVASFVEALIQVQPVFATKLLASFDGAVFSQVLEAAELPSPIQHVVANLLSSLAGLKDGKAFITPEAVAWLKGGLRGTSELGALCAVALSKLSRSEQSSEQESVLGDEQSRKHLDSQLVRRLISTVVDTPSFESLRSSIVLAAVEGLAYATLTPGNKVACSSSGAFLRALMALSSTPPQSSSMPITPVSESPPQTTSPPSSALVYGVAVILANVTSRPPKLTAEQTQVAKLRAMATSGQRSTSTAAVEEDPLDSKNEVEKRVQAVYDAGVVQAIRGFVLIESPLVKETLGKLILALVDEPSRRVRFLQEGGFRSLSSLVRDLVASPSPNANAADVVPATTLPTIQALAKLTITSNPSLLFPPPYLTTSINAVLPISILLLHSESSLLQQFESILALTNLASISLDLNDRVASLQRASTKETHEAGEVVKKVEALLLEDNDMIRRAATELLCNLTQGDVAFSYFTGANPNARGDPKVPSDAPIRSRPILNVLLVLMTVDDTNTRLAASGALASLTETGLACAALFTTRQVAIKDLPKEQRVGVWERIGELLDGEDRHPGLIHRGVVILYNLLLHVAATPSPVEEASLAGARSAGAPSWLTTILQSAMQGQVEREVAEVALQGLHVLK